MFLYKSNVTIFPFNRSALNTWYNLFWNSVEQDQLSFENPADLNIHSFQLSYKYMLIIEIFKMSLIKI